MATIIPPPYGSKGLQGKAIAVGVADKPISKANFIKHGDIASKLQHFKSAGTATKA